MNDDDVRFWNDVIVAYFRTLKPLGTVLYPYRRCIFRNDAACVSNASCLQTSISLRRSNFVAGN